MKSTCLLLALALVGTLAVYPQPPADPSTDVVDPPTRVARLNWLQGDVAFQPAGVEEWTTAVLNYPLTMNDHLFTNKDARVELHIGSNVIRLDSNSNFGFLNLDDNIVQVSLTDGSLEIHLATLPDDDNFEIATPHGAITLLSAGDYRVDTNSARDSTEFTVRSGHAEMYYGFDRVPIDAGRTAFLQTDQSPIIRAPNLYDDFDTFTEARDAKPRVDYIRSWKQPYSDDVTVADLVAEGMTGAEDLASVGTWQNWPGLGPIWSPPVDANWTPYSDGNWAYEEPWGWTWIDAAPWGFAPFHYGRWAYTAYRWVWVPGPKQKKQIYSPALVTFMGGGPADNVSWFPLGPRDEWTPPWRTRTDLASLPRLSTNRREPGAVLTMTPRDFIAGAHVRPSIGIAPEGQILGSSPSALPIRESVLVMPSRVHPPAFNRPLIVHTAPPPTPVLFVATFDLRAQNHGRPLAPRQNEAIRKQVPTAVMSGPPIRTIGPQQPRPQKPEKPQKPTPTRPQGKPTFPPTRPAQ